MSYEGKERRDEFDLGARVASLEANQMHLAETLKEVVRDLKGIILELAQKRAIEKFVYGLSASFFTIIGFAIDYLSRVGR